MRCDEVAAMLPMLVDASVPPNLAVEHHVETCLRCQAELARYRRLLRALHQLRTRFIEPTPGLLGETLAALEEAAERRAVRSVTGRRLAYAGAIGGTAVATAATAVLLIARSRKRQGPLPLAS